MGFSIAEEDRLVYVVVLSSSELRELEAERTMVSFVPAVPPECGFVIVEFEYCGGPGFLPWLV